MSETPLPTNWGRWGDDDQLGTLHLIDAEARRRAAAEVRDGRHISLARRTRPVPLTTGLGPVGSPATMPAGVLQAVNFNGASPVAMTDTLLVNTHNADLTHLDAVAHMPVDEHVYPGVPVRAAVTPTGVTHGSADPFGEGIVTRAVLLDVAPGGVSLSADKRVGATDLDAALERAATTLSAGDAVAVRAGWDTNRPLDQAVPGLDLSAVRWLDEHDVSIYVGDISDARPARFPMPMHQVALARLGLPLVDAADLEALALHCEASSRWSFMLVLAPPRITGTTGLVVNPVAVF
ncbi:cyclase [Streptomyces sp. SID8381]|uniref:cyclase family protein n=1 Tax=unclassified Streptomyces TaxID=2593676 RepID=UPI00039BFFEF|nr:cyclase family protein [Streptomyces sp. Amel2xE9]MYX30211.1 cyclase [Streptomyces sp. SID8381]